MQTNTFMSQSRTWVKENERMKNDKPNRLYAFAHKTRAQAEEEEKSGYGIVFVGDDNMGLILLGMLRELEREINRKMKKKEVLKSRA